MKGRGVGREGETEGLKGKEGKALKACPKVKRGSEKRFEGGQRNGQ